jgi:hypothetical protein
LLRPSSLFCEHAEKPHTETLESMNEFSLRREGRTRSAPRSVAARAAEAVALVAIARQKAATAAEKKAADSGRLALRTAARTLRNLSWVVPIGTPVKKVYYKFGSKSEQELCTGAVKSVRNVSTKPVYIVHFEADGYDAHMGHAELRALLQIDKRARKRKRAAPPSSAASANSWYWTRKDDFDVEAEYGDGNIVIL